MARTSILTDSTSGLSPEEVEALGIAIIPVHIELGGRTYREGVDLSLPNFYQLLNSDSAVPTASPPTVQEFHDVFRRLTRTSDEIIAILTSSRLSHTVSVARQAAQSLMGRSRVTIIDSRLAAAPLGWLALAAGEAAQAGVDTLEIIRLLRAMIPRMYLAFFVEDVEYLQRSGLASRAPAVAPSPAATKPLWMIEEGEIIGLERSRSRGRPVDRLFEFVAEFSHLERIAILQGRPMPESLELATLINEERPDKMVETRVYPPSIATYIGPDALGVAIYEGMG